MQQGRKFTRKIHTKRGAIEGIQSVTFYSSESDEDWAAQVALADDAQISLKQIIESAEEVLAGLPEPREGENLLPSEPIPIYGHSGFEKAPDGSLIPSSDPEILKQAETIVDYTEIRSLIKLASPEYFAWLAKEAAQAALEARANGEIDLAMSETMNAVENWQRMGLGMEHERSMAAKRESDRNLATYAGRKRKLWAEELAQSIRKRYPGEKFSKAMRLARLPVGNAGDHDPEYAGYRVWRKTYAYDDSALLNANCELSGHNDKLTIGTFRKMYFYKAGKHF